MYGWNAIAFSVVLLVLFVHCEDEVNEKPREEHKKDLNDDVYQQVLALQQQGRLRRACGGYGNAEQPPRRVNTTSRLTALREKMVSEVVLETKAIQAYIVTSNDEHQSVEIDEYERRREYISGFSGSYGDAIITLDTAALWTDGRYHLQADEQLDCNWRLFKEGFPNIPTRSEWLKKQYPDLVRIGVNPKLISEHAWSLLKSELEGSGLELVALNVSLIDLIWPDSERQPKRSKPAFSLDIKYSGKSYINKVEETRKHIQKAGADAMVVTSLDEVAWLLNIRGRDIPYSPFLRSYVILDEANIFLYVNSSQLTPDVLHSLNSGFEFRHKHGVQIKNYEDIWKDLKIRSQLYKKILVPSYCVYSEGASHAIFEKISPNRLLPRTSPIIYLKAVKNHVEIRGMRNAHVKDAAAMCVCLSHIEKRIKFSDSFTETDISNYLKRFRSEQLLSLGNSFESIVGFGANGAQPHYEPTPNTNARIFDNNTLVVDSGGQYYDGTTKVTRTLHFGIPTEDIKEAYTRVLIGMIQFSTLTFPNITKMAQADPLARGPLWEAGLDYLTETGHGIGAFLGVKESPIAIQHDLETSLKQHFQPGYFFTIGPGIYKENDFGIRLENVLEVVETPLRQHTSGHTFLGFRVLTLVPFEKKLMKLSLLSVQHRTWLNWYNQQIRESVGKELKQQNKTEAFYWMMEKTQYIPEYGHSTMILAQPLLFIAAVMFSTLS